MDNLSVEHRTPLITSRISTVRGLRNCSESVRYAAIVLPVIPLKIGSGKPVVGATLVVAVEERSDEDSTISPPPTERLHLPQPYVAFRLAWQMEATVRGYSTGHQSSRWGMASFS